jgi:hypothetical protein
MTLTFGALPRPTLGAVATTPTFGEPARPTLGELSRPTFGALTAMDPGAVAEAVILGPLAAAAAVAFGIEGFADPTEAGNCALATFVCCR